MDNERGLFYRAGRPSPRLHRHVYISYSVSCKTCVSSCMSGLILVGWMAYGCSLTVLAFATLHHEFIVSGVPLATQPARIARAVSALAELPSDESTSSPSSVVTPMPGSASNVATW